MISLFSRTTVFAKTLHKIVLVREHYTVFISADSVTYVCRKSSILCHIRYEKYTKYVQTFVIVIACVTTCQYVFILAGCITQILYGCDTFCKPCVCSM